MKTQLKLIPLFVIVAVACGGLYLSAFVRAQSSAPDSQATPNPDANKKEGTYGATNPSPTPTASPRR
jgi:hypothetical protein